MGARVANPHGTTTGYRNGCRCEPCKMAASLANKAHHEKNCERLNASCLARRNADPERWRNNYRQWRATNLEYDRQRVIAYGKVNAARIRETSIARYWNDPEKYRARFRIARRRRYAVNPWPRLLAGALWSRSHPMQRRARQARRRALQRKANGVATAAQIKARIDFYGGLCVYCGDPWKHLDHGIPLSRGGTNWPANIRPTCEYCNLTKGARSALVISPVKYKRE